MYKFDANPWRKQDVPLPSLPPLPPQMPPGQMPPGLPPVAGPGYPMPAQPDGGPSQGRMMMGKALGAFGSAFSQPTPPTNAPPMLMDNEAQRQARIAALRLPGYRYGGKVKKGQPIVVGDGQGPEVFVPPTNGTILPNLGDVPPSQVPGKAEYNLPDSVRDPNLPQPDYTSPSPQITLPQVTAPPVNAVPGTPPAIPPTDQDYVSQMGNGGGQDMSPISQPDVTPGLASPGLAPPVPLDAKGQPTRDVTLPSLPTLSSAQDDYNRILMSKEKVNPWLGGLFLALQGISKTFNPNDPTPVRSLADARKNEKLQEAGQVLGSLRDQAKYANDEAYRKAQTDYMAGRLPAEQAIADEKNKTEVQKQQDIAGRKLAGLPTYDPNNSAHRLLAKRAGMTDEEIGAMKGWDFKNPIEHVVDGERFKLNRADGEYYPTNLPVDESKSLTTFDAVDANGHVTATYHIPEDKAAQYAQQFKLKNIELKARATAQTNTLNQRHDEFMQKFNNQVEQQKKAGTYKRNTFIVGLDAALKAHQVTKEDYDAIVAALPNE